MSTTLSLLAASSYELSALNSALSQLLAPWGGMAAFVKAGDRVLLKPNLLTAGRPGGECITRPELVYCVAQQVQAVGGKPFIGDSPAFGTVKGVLRSNGYNDLLAELDIPVVEFQGERYPVANQRFNHLRLSKEALSADVVINLPKVKSHVQLTLTLGVKNLFGCVPGKMKAWWHLEAGKDAERFGEMLVETARAINPTLTILDGIMGHEGAGPMNGIPRPLGILAACPDVFALDWVMAQILNVAPERVPTLAAQQRLGLVPKNLYFPLAQPESLRVQDWQLPETLMPIDFGLPRVLRSTLKHFYVRFIREPLHTPSTR